MTAGCPEKEGSLATNPTTLTMDRMLSSPTDNRRHRGERVQNAYPGALLSCYFVYISSDLSRGDELTANEGQLT